MNRTSLALLILSVFATSALMAQEREVDADLLIVGATESGWAAAVTAVRLGVPKTLIVHDGVWFGGQFTEQALACVDENKGVGKVGWGVDWHPMKRSFHRSGLFRELMDQIEWGNSAQYGSRMPGRPFHGPSTFQPAEAEAIFRKIIQPYLDAGRIEVFRNYLPTEARVDETGTRPRLTGLTFSDAGGNRPELAVNATITIDASDWGEAIQLSGAAYECGPDPFSRYGEPSAPVDLQQFPANEMNPITWAMVVEESETPAPIAEPDGFDDRYFARATRLSAEQFTSLEWDVKTGLGSILHWPDEGKEAPRQLSVYTVRRLIDGSSRSGGKTSILLNYMNGQDYPLTRLPRSVVDALEETEPGASEKNIVEMTREQRQIIFDDAKNHSLKLLYHLQNFVHEKAPDKANSFRNFALSDQFGTADRLPPKPYIRESLRLKALYMMREQDGRNRDGETKTSAKERFSEVMYPDGLFAWQFHYDFHRTGRTYLKAEGNEGPWIDYEKPGRNTRYLSDRSVFPARSLIPVEMDGLLGAQKNLGYSSMVSAAIRLHDQCIHVGQAAAALAAVALKEKVDPRQIPMDRERLEEVRHSLCGGTWGRPLLLWPWRDLSPDEDAFVAVNRLSALGCLPIESEAVDFLPDEVATPGWKEEVMRLTAIEFPGAASLTVPESETESRGGFCRSWWEAIQSADLSPRPFPTVAENDADGDGILNVDDALIFTPNEPIVWGVRAPVLTPETDGLWTGEETGLERRFDFSGTGSREAEWDRGERWTEGRGFGWDRDMTQNFRSRSVYAEIYRDSFLFTREEAVWEVGVQDGIDYEVTVCIGDAGHDQPGQFVEVEGETLFEDVATIAGVFLEKSTVVRAGDGRISVKIGRRGSGRNTCLCWIVLRRL
ncbi:MAG: FAD-dependent oxidoreductase [Verrucomicrobiales bacterium]|nr:FAD-dependent oxidoreductase [Verrucomicrobiales bacterium]